MNTSDLTPVDIAEMSERYRNDNKASLDKCLEKKTLADHIRENNFRIYHILVLAGITYFVLRQHQLNERPIEIISG